MNAEEKRSAYKIQNVNDMSAEQLRHVLLTSDGRGVKFKTEALDELLKRHGVKDVQESRTTE